MMENLASVPIQQLEGRVHLAPFTPEAHLHLGIPAELGDLRVVFKQR